ncbi:hypothetical protein [Streptomyces sp. NPDC059003]|uniref:hypothetical protein n=1 Tax=Streptomyces sp. NPDC059003 TaxID=3346691 RepID=UPI0036B9496D
MAASKKTTSSRRPKPAKASAAFGKLNALSSTGALRAIDKDSPQASAEETAPVPSEAPDTASPTSLSTDAVEGASTPLETSAPRVPSPSSEDHHAPTSSPVTEHAAHIVGSGLEDASPGEDGVAQANSPERAAMQPPSDADVPASALGVETTKRLEQQDPSITPENSQPAGTSLAVRAVTSAPLLSTSGYSESGMQKALPEVLANKIDGLPLVYEELAKSYRRAKSTRTGVKPKKRNIRLHHEVIQRLNRQLVADKRMLRLTDLKPSQYVDAALTLAQGVSVSDLIKAADDFRDSHLGEQDALASPNHYSISVENYDWLDDMVDELLLANTTGLHGHMINVIIKSYLEQFQVPREG